MTNLQIQSLCSGDVVEYNDIYYTIKKVNKIGDLEFKVTRSDKKSGKIFDYTFGYGDMEVCNIHKKTNGSNHRLTSIFK